MHQRGTRHERIAEGHLPLLAQCDGLIEDRLREGQDLREAKELFQILPFLVIELVIAKHLHITDRRHGRRMVCNEPPQLGVHWLGRVDEDIAIDEHYPSRPSKARSCRSSRCHLTGSGMAAKVPRTASFSKRAAIAGPRVCASATGSTIVTWTLNGASVCNSGASPSHSRWSPRRRAL